MNHPLSEILSLRANEIWHLMIPSCHFVLCRSRYIFEWGSAHEKLMYQHTQTPNVYLLVRKECLVLLASISEDKWSKILHVVVRRWLGAWTEYV